MGTTVNNISIIGMGHLGASLAACCAAKGMQVTAMENDPQRVRLLKKGLAPVLETDLEELLSMHRDAIRITRSYRKLVRSSSITCITVPVWDSDEKKQNIQPLLTMLENIGKELRGWNHFHVIVIMSTLIPGTIDTDLIPAIQNESWKVNGVGVGVCYLPVFAERGRMIRELAHPKRCIIGSPGGKVRKKIIDWFSLLCDERPVIEWITPQDAEISKLMLDVWGTIQSGMVNMMGEMCEHMVGGDVYRVLENLKLTSNSDNARQLDSGLAGPYRMESLHIFRAWADKQRQSFPMIDAIEKDKHRQALRMLELVMHLLPDRGHVALLGVSYNPNTDSVENSLGMTLIHWLLKQDFSVSVYDAHALPQVQERFGTQVTCAGSVSKCIDGANAILILTESDEFRSLPIEKLQTQSSKAPVIVDSCRMFEVDAYNDKIRIIHPGIGYTHALSKPRNQINYNLIDLLEVSQLPTN